MARIRWYLTAFFSVLLLVATPAHAQMTCNATPWPLWQQFVTHLVQDSGRVLDASTPQQHSTSESQSYGMFFALVAGDRAMFDKMWTWSINNLGEGDLTKRLPAWLWGKAPDNSWGVLDTNSASDADLWFAYVLLEAGRLWKEPAYTQAAERLLTLIEGQEIAYLPQLGLMLLPGKIGFAKPEQGYWVLNPSYLPVPVLRRLALHAPSGPWNALTDNTLTLFERTNPAGFAPDWTRYQTLTPPSGFAPEGSKETTGSYDAIRTYLWAGMTSPRDPLFTPMLKTLGGMIKATESATDQWPPEKVDTLTGQTAGTGPFGFSAALLPYFQAQGKTTLATAQSERVQQAIAAALTPENLQKNPAPYYDFMLSLFGVGWYEQRYRFQANGTLSLPWESSCQGTKPR